MALKGLLWLKGIEYPKSHKIGKLLIEELKDEIAPDFLNKAAGISDLLAIDREPSFYGSEDAPAEELFDEEDAREVLRNAGNIIAFITGLLKDKKL